MYSGTDYVQLYIPWVQRQDEDHWNDMVNAWGEEARPIVVVGSIHIQRIECHNRAVNEQMFIGFKQEFHDLEREGILDPLNEPDMFCLQYIYLPRHLCPEMHAMTKMADLAKELHN